MNSPVEQVSADSVPETSWVGAQRDRVTSLGHALRRQSARLWVLVRSGASGAPISVAALATILVGAALTPAIGAIAVRHNVAIGITAFNDFRLWTVFTAGVFSTGVLGYVVAVVAVLVAAAPIEHRIGSLRFAIAALATQVLGAVLGVGVAVLARQFDEQWGFRLHLGTAMGPTTWIVGAVMVASSRMDTLWRRRIRVGGLALLITLALFSGHLQDLIRLAAAVVGLALGPVVVGRSARGPRLAGTQREGRVLVALVVAASALGPVLAALSPNAVGPFAVLRDVIHGVPYTASAVREICSASATDPECRTGLLELRLGGIGPTILSLLPSMFLLVLADGLRRGRRFAWIASVTAQVVLLLISAANYAISLIEATEAESVFYGLAAPTVYRTIVPFLLPAAVLVLLLVTRRFFIVRAGTGTYRSCGRSLLVVTGGLLVAYVVLGLVAGDDFDRSPTFAGLVADFPQRLVPPVYLQWLEPRLLPEQGFATLLFEWTGVVFWVTVCVAVLGTFLTVASRADLAATERARAVLRSSTGSALSWMTTWRGNSYWYSVDGTGYVAYRVISGVALTTGDPVGPPDRLRDNVVAFAEFAAGNGWIPCFYSVSPRVRAITDSIGWSGIQVGEETVLDLGELAFTGKRFQDVRTALNRAKKSGVAAEWISFPDAPLAITDQISAISEEWVADKGMPEMGFTLGGLDEINDPDVRCLIAVDEHRTVHGITSWMPVYEDGVVVGWTLDFMRRRASGFRPAMEFLIASAAISLQDEGARFLSLSGAPLAKVDDGRESETAPDDALTFSALLDRLLDLLGRTLEPVYGFRSLLAFKSKFQPRYESLHMTFADPAALPSIGNAIGRAYLPEVSLGQGYRLVRTLIDRK